MRGIAQEGVHQVSTRPAGVSTRASLGRLTSTQIAALRPGATKRDISDSAVPGLVLRIGISGAKYWLFRFKLKGRSSRIALGAFPSVSLAQARAAALENRDLLERGIDPRKAQRSNRRQPSAQVLTSDAARAESATAAPSSIKLRRSLPHPPAAPASIKPGPSLPRPPADDKHSVHFLAYEYIEGYVRSNREDPGYAVRVLEKDVLTEWEGRDARTITAREVVELLDKIVARGSPVMANRTADILGQMFKYGVHRSILDDSPVKLLFKPGGKEKSRKRVLSQTELTAFVTKLDEACRSEQKRHVLMVLLLTLQRRSELGLAQWKDFDFDAKTWRIPDEHAKNRRGHIVPLSDWAIEELQALKDVAGNSKFVVPSSRGNKPANPKLITRSVARSLPRFQKIGIDAFRPHDLRRTGRTELARLGVSKHIAERVLNHSKDVIEGTYDLYEYLDEKRTALNAWAQRLAKLRERRSQHTGDQASAHVVRKRTSSPPRSTAHG
jgi:integrase